MIYALVFIGRSGEPFPDGIEIYALPYALEILEDTNVDTELWALRRWIIEDVGDEWRVEDLDATGRLYHLRAATTRYRDQCSPPVHSASALNSLAFVQDHARQQIEQADPRARARARPWCGRSPRPSAV
jgi:hypothetical protein